MGRPDRRLRRSRVRLPLLLLQPPRNPNARASSFSPRRPGSIAGRAPTHLCYAVSGASEAADRARRRRGGTRKQADLRSRFAEAHDDLRAHGVGSRRASGQSATGDHRPVIWSSAKRSTAAS